MYPPDFFYAILSLGNCTPVRITPKSFSFGKTMCGMPFHSTYFWLRTITPTQAAGLNEHHDRKQNQSYPESFHRAALLLIMLYSPGERVAAFADTLWL